MKKLKSGGRSAQFSELLVRDSATGLGAYLLSLPLFVLDYLGLFGLTKSLAEEGVIDSIVNSVLELTSIAAAMLLPRIVLKRIRRARKRRVATLIALFIAATFAEIAVSIFRSVRFELATTNFSVESILYHSAVVAVSGTLVAAIERLRTEEAELRAKTSQLITARNTLEAQLAGLREEVSEAVQHAVKPILKSLEGIQEPAVAARFRLAQNDLKKIANSLLVAHRPLTAPSVQVAKNSFLETFTSLSAAPLILPKTITFVTCLLVFRLSIQTQPNYTSPNSQSLAITLDTLSFMESLFQMTTVSMSVYFAAWLGSRLVSQGRFASQPKSKQWVVQISALFVSSLMALALSGLAWTLLGLELNERVTSSLAFSFFVANLTTTGATAVFRAQRLRHQDLVDKIAALNNALESDAKRVSMQMRYERILLARIVHGPVQASLISSAVQLQTAKTQENQSTRQVAEEARERISAALERLRDFYVGQPLQAELAALRELWGGAIEVSVNVPEEVTEALSQDLSCSSAVVELISEFCANAVKHGHAKRVWVQIEMPAADRVRIFMENDAELNENASGGLGGLLLKELATNWSLTPGRTGTRLEVELPASTI